MPEPLATLQSALSGRYTVERELGRGGMATVYLARDDRQARQVAIKVLHPDLSTALGPERFQREIEIASSLTHPNIVPLYESGEAAGSLYYVMPYIPGETLRARLDREKQLPLEDAIRIACEIAGALDYAHRHGVIHRDVKPANILLEDGHAVIADFGIARALSRATGEHTLTMTGVTLGTPSYMSPEQASAEREIDGRSDIYALGCVVYEMLAGTPPFTGPNPQAVMARHAMDTAPSIRVIRSIIPPEVEAAIFCAMAKSPADRFATAQQFADALTGTGSMGTTLRYTARWAAAAQKRRRTKWSMAIAASILLPLGAGAGWIAIDRPGGAGDIARLDRTQVAVLYFDDVSRSGELAHVADALTESLIRELRRAGIVVRSQQAVTPFRDANVPVDSIADHLQVGSVVTGDVDAVGDSGVQIGVRLVDGNTGDVLERGSFRLPVARLLEAPDSLVQEVATFFRERLGRAVQVERALAEASNVDAWSHYRHALSMSREAMALAEADSATEAARRFARADSLLALAESIDPRWIAPRTARAELALEQVRRTSGADERRRLVEAGLAHASRALALDSLDAHALEVRGTLRYGKRYLNLVADPTEREALLASAERDLREATRQDRSRATAWNTLSLLLYRKLDRIQSYEAARTAWEADAYLQAAPDILFRLYSIAFDLGETQGVERWCTEGRRRFPELPDFYECQLWLMTMPGHQASASDVPRAWAALDSMRVRTPPARWEETRRQFEMIVAVPIAKAGLADSAQRVIERARGTQETDPRGELVGREIQVQTLIGEKDRALELLGRYFVAHPDHREGFDANSWWWASLQSDPRFKALVGH